MLKTKLKPLCQAQCSFPRMLIYTYFTVEGEFIVGYESLRSNIFKS